MEKIASDRKSKFQRITDERGSVGLRIHRNFSNSDRRHTLRIFDVRSEEVLNISMEKMVNNQVESRLV